MASKKQVTLNFCGFKAKTSDKNNNNDNEAPKPSPLPSNQEKTQEINRNYEENKRKKEFH